MCVLENKENHSVMQLYKENQCEVFRGIKDILRGEKISPMEIVHIWFNRDL